MDPFSSFLLKCLFVFVWVVIRLVFSLYVFLCRLKIILCHQENEKIIRKYSLRRSGVFFPIVIEKFISISISISIANLHIFVSKNGIETIDFKIEWKRWNNSQFLNECWWRNGGIANTWNLINSKCCFHRSGDRN